jgi:quercetin dioxygenase-like cupin family protein
MIMTKEPYPGCIKDLPRAKIPFPGVHGWVAQGIETQTVFFEIEPIGSVTPHSHGAQYGFVIEGEMVLTIDGESKSYTRGDTYFIPEGVTHQAEFKTFCRVIDIFFEPRRYELE